MFAFTKNIAIFGFLLVAATSAHSMMPQAPHVRLTHNGFQVCNRTTGLWSPEIQGTFRISNNDDSLIISRTESGSDWGKSYVLADAATGNVLCTLINRAHVRCGFSPSGKIVYVFGWLGPDAENQHVVIVNTAANCYFQVMGTELAFGCDENFVSVIRRSDGRKSQTIFSTETGEPVHTPDQLVTLHPTAPIMFIGEIAQSLNISADSDSGVITQK